MIVQLRPCACVTHRLCLRLTAQVWWSGAAWTAELAHILCPMMRQDQDSDSYLVWQIHGDVSLVP